MEEDGDFLLWNLNGDRGDLGDRGERESAGDKLTCSVSVRAMRGCWSLLVEEATGLDSGSVSG